MVRIEVVADGLGFTEGPVLLPDGRAALVSISHGCVYLVAKGGSVQPVATGGGPNGLAVADDGTLYVAQNGGIWGASGPAEPGVQVLRGGAVDYLVRGFGAPNDLTFGPDGRLWVTDTRGEITWTDPTDALPGRVWAVDPTSGAAELVLDDGPLFLNGLAFAPDGQRLLVTETLAAVLTSYAVTGDGLGPPEAVHRFAQGHPDGMAVDTAGTAWVALTSANLLGAVSADGELVATLPLGAESLPTNVCLGETPGELLVTAAHAGALLRVQVDAG